ncbi:MAG: asparagine--tRNA ligase [Oscillospiraceae bacterium]|jgi:asparaginyl-tRNA synthetase
MKHQDIRSLYENTGLADGAEVEVEGWVRTSRESKQIGFISLNDGSCLKNLQVVIEEGKISNFKELANASVGSAVRFSGKISLTPGMKQPFELKAEKGEVTGKCGPDFPIQKKKTSLEYLRTIPHLRARTNTFEAVYRVRGECAYAIHEFFHENGFTYINTPIITGSDAEGAGEMFQVTTLDLADVPKNPDGTVDYTKDFFKRETNLTVSGQLEAEGMALALGKVYTFGPTFRAENSNTQRHAAEFWMIEPEMAFFDLEDDMDTEEAMIKFVISKILERCPDEIDFFTRFYDKDLRNRLEHVAGSKFARVTYTEAIEELKKNEDNFEFKPYWGCDLQTEHERYLTEKVYGKPVFVTDYPKDIKAFYMKQNDDGKTVAAVDLLVPGIGELCGGSQREEDYDKLLARIREMGLRESDYDWYLDLRRFGTVVHSGFGLGFERLIMYVTGMQNIRDVELYPRTVGGFSN